MSENFSKKIKVVSEERHCLLASPLPRFDFPWWIGVDISFRHIFDEPTICHDEFGMAFIKRNK
jgi:hypothetical protein